METTLLAIFSLFGMGFHFGSMYYKKKANKRMPNEHLHKKSSYLSYATALTFLGVAIGILVMM